MNEELTVRDIAVCIAESMSAGLGATISDALAQKIVTRSVAMANAIVLATPVDAPGQPEWVGE